MCSLGDDRTLQQYVDVISLTYEWTQMESQAQSVCVTCCYVTHTVWTTGNWAVLAATSCSLILLWFKHMQGGR